MVVLNRMSRFHLAQEVLRRARPPGAAGWDALAELCERRLAEHAPTSRSTSRTCPTSPTGPGGVARPRGDGRAGPVVSTRGHQHLHRRHRGPVRQVRGGGRPARPAGPPGRPGRRLPADRARRRAGRAGPDAAVAAARRPHRGAGLRRDLRRAARLDPERAMGVGRRPVPRRRPATTTSSWSWAPTSPTSRRPRSSRSTPRVAANLGSRLLLVVPAQGHDPADGGHDGRDGGRGGPGGARPRDRGGGQPGGAGPARRRRRRRWRERVRLPVQALPETPLLRAPTVKDLMDACWRPARPRRPRAARPRVHGPGGRGDDDAARPRPARSTVGWSSSPGTARTWCSGVLLAHRSKTFPSLSGIVLNGGFPLPPQVERLIEGLDVVLPIIATDGGTMTTATAARRGPGAAHARVHPQARGRRGHGRARARRRGAARPGQRPRRRAPSPR